MPVLIQLLEKIFIFLFRCGFIHLVFHFKHDGNKFGPVRIRFFINIIALAAGSGIVVLFKVCILETGCAQLVEFCLTVLL